MLMILEKVLTSLIMVQNHEEDDKMETTEENSGLEEGEISSESESGSDSETDTETESSYDEEIKVDKMKTKKKSMTAVTPKNPKNLRFSLTPGTYKKLDSRRTLG